MSLEGSPGLEEFGGSIEDRATILWQLPEDSPGLVEFRESVDERATIFWHVRTVPFIEFIVRDKKGTTGSFIKKLLDERLSVYVLDGLTGEPCFGTDYMKTTIKVFRKAMQKTDWQHAS